MQRSTLFLVLGFLLALSACNWDKEFTSVKYKLSQCCNFYDEASSCSSFGHLERATCFFEEMNIEVSEPEIKMDGVISICGICCLCPEGQSLFLEVADEDLERLLDLGFERI